MTGPQNGAQTIGHCPHCPHPKARHGNSGCFEGWDRATRPGCWCPYSASGHLTGVVDLMPPQVLAEWGLTASPPSPDNPETTP